MQVFQRIRKMSGGWSAAILIGVAAMLVPSPASAADRKPVNTPAKTKGPVSSKAASARPQQGDWLMALVIDMLVEDALNAGADIEDLPILVNEIGGWYASLGAGNAGLKPKTPPDSKFKTPNVRSKTEPEASSGGSSSEKPSGFIPHPVNSAADKNGP